MRRSAEDISPGHGAKAQSGHAMLDWGRGVRRSLHTPSNTETRMSNLVRRSIGPLLALVALAALLAPKLTSLGRADAPAAEAVAKQEEPLAVRVVRAAPQTLRERLLATGTVRANEKIDLISEISGKVRAIHFREGTRVEAGELLVEIDSTELTAERDRVRLQVELAERREARQRELLDDGVISEQDHDFVENQLNVLRAELRRIEAQLVKTEIRAPFAGTIGLRGVSLGGYLTPQMPIATLQDLDPAKIDFTIPEKYAGQVGVGREIVFHTAGSEVEHRGRIYAVEPNVDPQTRSLLLRAESPNPGGALLPGVFADVELAVREVEGALTVPAMAVIPELGGKKVFVVEDGRAVARQVETGMRGADRVEIVEGLEPGDAVIVSAIQQLRDGMPVRIADGG